MVRKEGREELVRRFKEIRLKAGEGRGSWNAEKGKHRYGGVRE